MLARPLAAIALGILVATTTGCAVSRGQETTGQYFDDTAITAKVKSAYASDPQVAATSISVETMQGTVLLSGFAKSQAEKDRAATLAREVKGVKSVKNDIVVRP